ncbi:MAG: YidC/Oxa1 family membrane protein insertase [Candidatus Moraniibacteriota bacterium]
MLGTLYNEILYRPLLNLLVELYNIFGDFGIAIIVVTIIVRAILYPVAKKSLVHQKQLKKIQPKMKELQEKHKDDKEKLTAEMMALYKEHNFNPASGCLPMIIQFIILIALYRVFITGIDLDTNYLYDFVAHPGKLNTSFFGLFDLGTKSMNVNFGELFKGSFGKGLEILNWGGVVLAMLAGAAQFLQTKLMITTREKKKEEEKPQEKPAEKPAKGGSASGGKSDGMPDMAEALNKQMLYFFPLMTIYIGVILPAGLALYWVVSTALLIGQQYILDREDRKI